jgi:hypothetical protein
MKFSFPCLFQVPTMYAEREAALWKFVKPISGPDVVEKFWPRRYSRQLLRAIAVNPKITAAQLRVEVAPELSMKTIYRYLKKSGIQ